MRVFPKIMVPQIIHVNRVFHYKPSILGYPCFWGNTHEPICFFLDSIRSMEMTIFSRHSKQPDIPDDHTFLVGRGFTGYPEDGSQFHMGTGKKHPGINFEVQLIWIWRKHHGPTSDLNTTSDLKLRNVEWKMCERCKGDLLGEFFLTANVTLPNHPISHGSNHGFSCYKDVISNSFILNFCQTYYRKIPSH